MKQRAAALEVVSGCCAPKGEGERTLRRHNACRIFSGTGEPFLRSLVEHLREALAVPLVFVCERAAEDGERALPLAVAGASDFRDDCGYGTAGTPCAEVAARGAVWFESGLRERFPQDAWLARSGYDSYAAVPLFGDDGTPLGHLGVLGYRATPGAESPLPVLEALAERTAAEIVRQRTQVELRLERDRLRRSRAELRNLTMHLQKARENERASIARELHDELGQVLTVLKMDLVRLCGRLPAKPLQLRAQANKAVMGLDGALEVVQRVTSNLRPALLDDLGLVAAIEWQVREFEKHFSVRCRTDLPDDEPLLDQDQRTALFRILQEGLTNVGRHSGASNAKVSLRRDAERLTLTVADDGRGTSPDALDNGRSFGLLGMRERASFLGGDLSIESEPAQGTTVRVSVPLG